MALLSHSLPQGLDAESLLSGNPDVAFTEDTEENGELDNAFKREQKLQADPTSMAMYDSICEEGNHDELAFNATHVGCWSS